MLFLVFCMFGVLCSFGNQRLDFYKSFDIQVKIKILLDCSGLSFLILLVAYFCYDHSMFSRIQTAIFLVSSQ